MMNEDQTVLFRRHLDGSLTIIGLDGVILDHITADRLRGETEDCADKTAFYLGLLSALLISAMFWGSILWLMKR